MLSKTPFRIAGAAMLGTVALLGTNAANAQIGIDDNGKLTNPAVYARETLMKQDEKKLEGYYTLMELESDDAHDVAVSDFSYSNGDMLRMTLTLNGMKFAAALQESDGLIDGATDINLLGGGVGESIARYTLTGGTGDAVLTVELDDLAIASGASSGSIVISITNVTDEEGFGPGVNTKEYSYTGAVKVVNGLVESFKGQNALAAVTSSFKEFHDSNPNTEDTVTYAALGTLNISVKTDGMTSGGDDQYVRSANTGERLNNDDDGLGALIEFSSTDADNSSSIEVSGNFSFATAAWLEDVNAVADAPPACMGGAADAESPANTGDIIQKEDDVVQMDLAAQNVNLIAAATSKTLCMSVGGEDAEDAMKIVAASYSVTTDYGATGEMQAHSAMSDTHSLGKITRDGTTVRIPFITTNPALKQRIAVNNRSGGPVTFDFSFVAEGDATAMATAMASGDTDDDTGMPGGLNSYLVSDLVEIMGRPKRGAAEFVAEAGSSQIDVSTIINDEGGAPEIQKLTTN